MTIENFYWDHWLENSMEQNLHRSFTVTHTMAIEETLEIISILIIAGICITIILGAAILWNQRKIKKMLRQIQEESKNKPQ